MMDVVATAWRAAGSPRLSVETKHEAICAGCGASDGTIAVADVVSDRFTAYDTWIYPASPALCPACAWAYRTAELRTSNFLVELRTPALTRCSRSDVATILAAGRLAGHHALTVPLRPGRQHLLPLARWGCVATNHATIPWSDDDARRLRTVQHLREIGFTSSDLAAPAPPWRTLSRQPRDIWTAIIAQWQELEPWRIRDSPWLELASHVTSTKKA